MCPVCTAAAPAKHCWLPGTARSGCCCSPWPRGLLCCQVTRTVRAVASQAGGATPAKQSWLPGTPIPPYLEDLPAAYGFDPLRLGTNAGALRWCALARKRSRCNTPRRRRERGRPVQRMVVHALRAELLQAELDLSAWPHYCCGLVSCCSALHSVCEIVISCCPDCCYRHLVYRLYGLQAVARAAGMCTRS